MALAKRELPVSVDELHYKRLRVSECLSSQSPAGDVRVVLNPADCDIDFNVEGDGLRGSALYEDGFAYCWSGARANIGIIRGKYCFGCKIVACQAVEMEDTPFEQQNVCRVGISRGDDSVQNLGETDHSFGFSGTGKFSNSGNFVNYGEKFGVGDTIVCAVDLESRPLASIAFLKNGKWMGVATHFDSSSIGFGVLRPPMEKRHWESALFPHVLLKNVVVQLQFTTNDGLIPLEGYKPWTSAIRDGNAVLGPSLSTPDDCEVIMMVGLPASGKTTWAEKFAMEHPEKRYVLLGTNLAMEQMKVPGLLRKHNYDGQFDRLMDRAKKILNVLLTRASKIHHNYIIDQTNVYKNARKRKLKFFATYMKIAVVVFPKPEELKFRAEKRFQEMGKEVPLDAVDEILANFTFPMSKDMHMADEYFDQVMFVELGQAEAQRFLDEMKRELTVKPYVSPYSHENSSTSSASSQSYYFKNQGVFYHYQSPYSYRLPLQEPYGDSSRSFTYDSRQEYDVLGSFRGYECNESHGKLQLPSLGGFDDEYLCYGSGDTYSHSGSRSRHFSDGVTVDPNRSNIGESYSRTSSSLNDIYYDRLAEGSAERPVDFPATGHSSYHLTPFQHGGSSTAHNSGSPSRSFSNDVQHGRIHHQLNPLVPPTVDKPMDMHPPDGSFSTHPPHPGGAHPQPSMPAYPSQNIHMDVDHHPLHPSPFCQGS